MPWALEILGCRFRSFSRYICRIIMNTSCVPMRVVFELLHLSRLIVRKVCFWRVGTLASINNWVFNTNTQGIDSINAYYIFVLPFFPLLPPPAVCQYEDHPVGISLSLSVKQADRSHLPFWPASPFRLALLALLVLTPGPDDPRPMEEAIVSLRRSYAETVCPVCSGKPTDPLRYCSH